MENLEKQLQNVRKIRMTNDERDLMRLNINKFMDNHIPELSYAKKKVFRHSYSMHIFKVTGIVFASFVVLIAGGSGISYKADSALPGDTLYSLKINTIEEVRGAFIKSPQEKLLYNQARVAKRIEEIVILAEEGNLTTEKGIEVEKALDSHIANIEEAAKKLKDSNPEGFKNTTDSIAPLMEQHKNTLKEVNKKAETVTEKSLPEKKEAVVDPMTKDINGKVLENTTDKDKVPATLAETTIEKKKEESKKAVDNIIAKIEKETDSIKAMEKETVVSPAVKSENPEKTPLIKEEVSKSKDIPVIQ